MEGSIGRGDEGALMLGEQDSDLFAARLAVLAGATAADDLRHRASAAANELANRRVGNPGAVADDHRWPTRVGTLYLIVKLIIKITGDFSLPVTGVPRVGSVGR